jgi:ferrous iron transport protein B
MKKAGTVILAISILLWAMMTFPVMPDHEKREFQAERDAIYSALSPDELALLKNSSSSDKPDGRLVDAQKKLAEIDSREASTALRHSLAGRIGTVMEHATMELTGFDWRTNIALLGGIAAKEVIISTLGTAYSLGCIEADAPASLSETLAANPSWSPLKALSVIIFIMFYAPCFVTVVCITRESGSWKWGLFSILFNTTLAFAMSMAIYNIGRLFF